MPMVTGCLGGKVRKGSTSSGIVVTLSSMVHLQQLQPLASPPHHGVPLSLDGRSWSNQKWQSWLVESGVVRNVDIAPLCRGKSDRGNHPDFFSRCFFTLYHGKSQFFTTIWDDVLF